MISSKALQTTKIISRIIVIAKVHQLQACFRHPAQEINITSHTDLRILY